MGNGCASFVWVSRKYNRSKYLLRCFYCRGPLQKGFMDVSIRGNASRRLICLLTDRHLMSFMMFTLHVSFPTDYHCIFTESDSQNPNPLKLLVPHSYHPRDQEAVSQQLASKKSQ